MCIFKKRDIVTIIVDSYLGALVTKMFLEYVLECKPALYYISSIKKNITLVQSYISEVEALHDVEAKLPQIDVIMDEELYNRCIKDFA